LFVDLCGHTAGKAPVEPVNALVTLLRQLGVTGEGIPDALEERIRLWRTTLADRRVLVVLDNALTASQVEPLLPGSGSSFVMVTSRRRLAGLDGVRTVSLDALPEPEALTLLASVVGDTRPDAEPCAALTAIRLCGRLPLAIRIAGARLRHRPTWTVGALAERLGDEQGRLSELGEEHRGVVNAFAVSYRRLTAEQRAVFEALGRHFGIDFDVYHVAAMTGLSLRAAGRILQELVDVHMLTEPAMDRYKLHDLLRAYAAAVAQAATDTVSTSVPDRLLDYLLCTAARADGLLNPKPQRWPLSCAYPPAHMPALADAAAALGWFNAENETLLSAIRFAASHGRLVHAWKLPYLASRFWDMWNRSAEAVGACEAALAAVGALDDPLPAADLLYCISRLCRHDDAKALVMGRQALERYRQAGHPIGQGDALTGLGLVHERLGDYEAAIGAWTEALAIARDVEGDRPSIQVSAALNNLAVIHGRMGRLDEAIELLIEATNHAVALGDEHGAATNLSNIGFAYMMKGSLETSEQYLLEALAVYERAADAQRQADMLSQLGVVASRRGRHEQALAYHDRTAALLDLVAQPERAAELHNNRGQSQAAAGLVDEALNSHERALEVARQMNRRYEQARALAALAELSRNRDPEGAQRRFAEALRIYDDLGVPEADELRAAANARRGQPARPAGRVG
jgi:tetratricopeptide (TPR) repeat protein